MLPRLKSTEYATKTSSLQQKSSLRKRRTLTSLLSTHSFVKQNKATCFSINNNSNNRLNLRSDRSLQVLFDGLVIFNVKMQRRGMPFTSKTSNPTLWIHSFWLWVNNNNNSITITDVTATRRLRLRLRLLHSRCNLTSHPSRYRNGWQRSPSEDELKMNWSICAHPYSSPSIISSDL
jgi:hypothetical protein